MRTILHVDMDQFYAAVEMRDRPELRGLPLVIGADPKGGRGRGVVSTASYEARKFGVRSALPVSTAYRLCPQAVFLPVDMEKYAAVSAEIQAVFLKATPLVEPLSLDEAFLDMTQSRLLMGDGRQAAARLKAEVFRATRLTCSVGVAPNKFLAKIASDLKKPDGLVVVEPGREREFLAPLPVARVWGVGPKTEALLKGMGIVQVGQLQDFPLGPLSQRLGSFGAELKELALGRDDRPVVPDQEAKSLGRETTFERDTAEAGTLRQTLAGLCEEVAGRLRAQALRAGQVTLKLRFEGFETHTRQRPLRPASSHGPELLEATLPMLREFLKGGRRVRLLGVAAGRLEGGEPREQMELFGQDSEKKNKVDLALDKVRARFGGGALTRASQMALRESEFQEASRRAGQAGLSMKPGTGSAGSSPAGLEKRPAPGRGGEP